MYSGARGNGFTVVLALWVCAAALVGGCGGQKQTKDQAIAQYSQDLREAVSTHVRDEPRRAQMLLIVDQLEVLHRRFSQETVAFIETYRTLNADYDATRPAFDQLFLDYRTKRTQARTDALELHFRLASLATVDEWDPIVKAETRLYEKVNAAHPAEEAK